MLFDEYEDTIQVYELVRGVGYSDPVPTLVGTITGRFEAMQGSEVLANGQTFGDVSDIFLTDYANVSLLVPGRLLVGTQGVQRRIAGKPEEWSAGLIHAHAAVRCQHDQWSLP